MAHRMGPAIPLGLIPLAPWLPKQALCQVSRDKIYETCRRGDKGHCINSNYVRVCGEELNRQIRVVQTFKGYLYWSEYIEEYGWCRFRAPLNKRYAKMIDGFDYDGKHFKPPIERPMGETEFLGYCEERTDPLEVRQAREMRMAIRIANGDVTPKSKFRERQLPYVQSRLL